MALVPSPSQRPGRSRVSLLSALQAGDLREAGPPLSTGFQGRAVVEGCLLLPTAPATVLHGSPQGGHNAPGAPGTVASAAAGQLVGLVPPPVPWALDRPLQDVAHGLA